jgi:hypothetical protein
MSTPTAQTEPTAVPVPAPAYNGGPATRDGAFSPGELAFLIGVPLAWAVLLLFHPTGDGETITYADLQDKVTAWLVVHIGMMLFIPLMAAAVFLLLRGIDSTAARVSRIALVPFVVVYGAYEVLVGIGTGILVQDVNGLESDEQAAGAALVNEFTDNVLIRGFSVLSSIGALAFITAMIAAGIAIRRETAAPLSVPVLLGLSGFLITAHPPPFGPIGLVLFIAAALLFARSQARSAQP